MGGMEALMLFLLVPLQLDMAPDSAFRPRRIMLCAHCHEILEDSLIVPSPPVQAEPRL